VQGSAVRSSLIPSRNGLSFVVVLDILFPSSEWP
jgi:hypothetical protein